MEVWRDIEGYEGLYQVSNLGRVRSLKKNKMIMKPFVNEEGYLRLLYLKIERK
ncbi:NUMOD4 domain-containing protein [Bacillus pacificus]